VKIPRPDLAAYALCALTILAIFGLTLAGKTVPDVLQFVAITALGGGAGISLNTPNGKESLPRSSSTPAPAPRVSPPAPRPAPAPAAVQS
jgi:hypothetical protein